MNRDESILLLRSEALQDIFAPQSRCFGCGPANDRGLRIKSRVAGDQVVAEFSPQTHHQAFEGVLNGGIIGALLDCHSNWTAAWHLMKTRGDSSPPCTVTAEYHVTMRRPTPMETVRLLALVESAEADRVVVTATLEAGARQTASFRGTFVAVKEGHPAFHRW